MRYYPIQLDIENRPCLVVGGGSVATRKTEALLNCGAGVTVVSPESTERLLSLAEDGIITLNRRAYRFSDMEGMFLVIGATNDRSLNHQVHRDAERLKILCNIADQPRMCNFILPSVVHRGDLVITISTSGKSPAYAKRLRKELEGVYGEEHALFLSLMGAIRQKLLRQDHRPDAHQKTFTVLIDGGLLDLIKDGNIKGVDALLYHMLGEGFEYETLMKTAG